MSTISATPASSEAFIANDWQARGSGRALLARLEREAAASGVRRMLADTHYDNKAMRALAVRSGYEVQTNRNDARLVRLEKRLNAPVASPTVDPLAA